MVKKENVRTTLHTVVSRSSQQTHPDLVITMVSFKLKYSKGTFSPWKKMKILEWWKFWNILLRFHCIQLCDKTSLFLINALCLMFVTSNIDLIFILFIFVSGLSVLPLLSTLLILLRYISWEFSQLNFNICVRCYMAFIVSMPILFSHYLMAFVPGCPFKHTDVDMLRQKLQGLHVSKSGIDEVGKVGIRTCDIVWRLFNPSHAWFILGKLTHWGRARHICVTKTCQHWRRKCLVPCLAPSHYLKFLFQKLYLKMPPAKWHPFCLSLKQCVEIYLHFLSFLNTNMA